MTVTSLRERLLQRVTDAFTTMPGRFLGAEPGFDATFEVRLGDIGRTWQVRLRGQCCEVKPSPGREPDVVIGTDAPTWLALREGRTSGLDAFSSRRLYARGNLDLALGFEGMFALPGGRRPLLRIGDVETAHGSLSSLVSGAGDEQIVCLHGLGSNKTSFFETVSALTPDHTVHAVDLPGFGSSSKPARAGYDAPYFARATLGYLDAMAIERAHLVGNSMGGRVALEVAFAAPERIASLTLLSPSLAFRRRRALVPLVKLLRPELAAFPHPIRGELVRRQLWSMFARPERLDPAARAPRGWRSSPPRETSTSTRRGGRTASGPASRRSRRRHSSSGATATAWCLPASPATWPERCPAPSRPCSPSAGTCRRSSFPCRRTG